jgi:hypothetical protein
MAAGKYNRLGIGVFPAAINAFPAYRLRPFRNPVSCANASGNTG